MTDKGRGVGRVLVAEDDPDVHVLLELLLGSAGYEVEMVRDGAGALAALGDGAGVDLLIMDVAMPGGLDGVAVTREVRAGSGHASLPVVLLSARSQPAEIEAGLAAGANDYVIKPFDADDLLTRIGSLLRRPNPPRGGTAPR